VKITKQRLKEIIKEELEALNLQEVGPRSEEAWGRREAEIDHGADGGWAPARLDPVTAVHTGEGADIAYHGRGAELEHGQEVSPYHDLAAAAAAGDEEAFAKLEAASRTDPNALALLNAIHEEPGHRSVHSVDLWEESKQRTPKNFKLTKNTLKHLVKKEFKRLK
jgi:hypothetical protein